MPGRHPLALLAALLYALGVVVLPGLHISLHRDDHDHAGGGIRYAVRFGGVQLPVHEHAPGAVHTHTAAVDDDDDAPGHVHDVGGAALQAASHPHSHSHSHSQPHPHPAPSSPAAPDSHGQGSLSHFASATLTAPTPWAALTWALQPTQLVLLPPPAQPPKSQLRRIQGARAPPFARLAPMS